MSGCPVTVSCGSPIDGAVGVAYTHTFPTTGGPNLFFSISSGSLPPGLTLDPATGIVSGKPTTAGSYAFTVKVIDAQIMATGDDGSFSDSQIVITSDDGNTWAQQTTAITDSGFSVIYSDALGLWINGTQFAGMTDQIQSSPDGVSGNWTAHSSPADGHAVSRLIAGKDKVVALYSFGAMTTTDGSTWTDQPLPGGFSGGGQPDIAYSPDLDLYVITGAHVGGTDGVYTSPDGITWTFVAQATMGDVFTLTWGAGLFVAMGGPQGSGIHLWTSPDGSTWTVQADPGGSAQNWQTVRYANGHFVAVSVDGSTNPTQQAATSTDGINWTLRNTPAVKHWTGLAYGYGFWIAGANNSPSSQPLMKSTDDGATWSLVSALGFNFGFIKDIAFGPLNNCSATANCTIVISGPSQGNFWRGMVQGAGNHF